MVEYLDTFNIKQGIKKKINMRKQHTVWEYITINVIL